MQEWRRRYSFRPPNSRVLIEVIIRRVFTLLMCVKINKKNCIYLRPSKKIAKNK